MKTNNPHLETKAARILTAKKRSLAVAESCTGGLVSHRLTNVSGSSKYFRAGIVSYSNESKINLLGVRRSTIKNSGAVSKKTAVEMAQGIRRLAKTDIGIGLTGIAGPISGVPAKPVGLVYIAFVNGTKHIAREFRFKGSREEIKFHASEAALHMIIKNV